jgi:hypothetical protein
LILGRRLWAEQISTHFVADEDAQKAGRNSDAGAPVPLLTKVKERA